MQKDLELSLLDQLGGPVWYLVLQNLSVNQPPLAFASPLSRCNRPEE